VERGNYLWNLVWGVDHEPAKTSPWMRMDTENKLINNPEVASTTYKVQVTIIRDERYL
jgi:hypothetical protein